MYLAGGYYEQVVRATKYVGNAYNDRNHAHNVLRSLILCGPLFAYRLPGRNFSALNFLNRKNFLLSVPYPDSRY